MSKIVIYQILTRLFGNQETANIQHGSIHENGCGKFNHITSKALSEIKALGVSHIWYTGVIEHAKVTDYSAFGMPGDPPHIVKGKAGSPYAIKDYYNVDPDLAVNVDQRMAEFQALVDRSHHAGLKVIIDFVPNHVSRTYKSLSRPANITDLGQRDHTHMPFSPDNNFYYLLGTNFHSPIAPAEGQKVWHESPAKVTGNDCFNPSPSVHDWYETVKLNYGVDLFHGRAIHFDPIPDTWNKMLQILMFWTSYKIDGFRCDMAEMVPVSFWNWAIKKVKEKYPDMLFVAEVYNPSLYHNFIHQGGFDLLYDKVGMYDILRGVIENQRPAGDILNAWNAISNIHEHMLFFLENHDEQRIASSFFAGDAQKGWPGFAVAATLNSNAVMVYFGQEIGVNGMDHEGFSGLDGRTSIFDYWGVSQFQNWVNNGNFDNKGLTSEQLNIREQYKKLLNFTLAEIAQSESFFYDLSACNANHPGSHQQSVYPYLRYNKDHVWLFVVNFSEQKLKLRLVIPEHAFLTCGLELSSYIKSVDIMDDTVRIQFPSQVAFVTGVGISIPAYHLSVFCLK
jgi:glycosidase